MTDDFILNPNYTKEAHLAELEAMCDGMDETGDRGNQHHIRGLVAAVRSLQKQHYEEIKRLRAQARCGHSPWPCQCDYRGGHC